MSLVACNAMFMAQERGCVPFNGGQGTAQFVAHSCEQFCLKQFHSMECFALCESLQFREAFNREHIMCFSILLVHALVPSLLRFFENYSAPRPLGILLLTEIA